MSEQPCPTHALIEATTPIAADNVSRIINAWQHERPDLHLEPMQVLSRVTRLARHLDIERRAAFQGHDLEPWEFDCLAALRRNGAPYELSAGALIAQTMVTSGTMTNRIERLRARNLVERRKDAADGRAVLVRLTQEGKTKVDGALEDLLSRERHLLVKLGVHDQQHLAALLALALQPFEQQ